MKLGTENKRNLYILIGLSVVALYMLYTNVLSDPAGSKPSRPAAVAPAGRAEPSLLAPSGAGGSPAQGSNIRRATPGRSNKGDEFHPTLRSKRPEERVDPATIDPTIRFDLLAKVQGVAPGGGSRNIFQFGQPPAKAALKDEPKVALGPMQGPKTPEEVKADEAAKVPPKTPPPPINLKYYGYSTRAGSSRKTAFFLDGEDILVAGEGDTVKKRYKVVRIGVNSVLMEDTVANHQQSLPLQEEQVGAA